MIIACKDINYHNCFPIIEKKSDKTELQQG